MTIPFCLGNQDVASSESQEMGRCIPREYQTLSSFETNVLLAYKLQTVLQASTTNAFLCVCSQNFLTTRPHSVRNNMFIVKIMYRRCNFNVTFSKQKLLDINIKAVWLNGLYCELVDLADVDIIKLYLHLPSAQLTLGLLHCSYTSTVKAMVPLCSVLFFMCHTSER